MEGNEVIQVALLAVLPLIMQGLKKISWIENNKAWVCPLICITASTVAAYFLQLPQWLLVGILTGAACNKVYDWTKNIKNSVTANVLLLLLFSIVGPVVLASCTDNLSATGKGVGVVREAYDDVASRYEQCDVGDMEDCEQCLDSAVALFNYINYSGEVQMTAETAMLAKQSFMITSEFYKRCQNGDPNACRMGCQVGYDNLTVIWEGIAGIVRDE